MIIEANDCERERRGRQRGSSEKRRPGAREGGRRAHLVLRLAQQLLLAEVVQPQRLADARDEPALEREERLGHLVALGLVQELERTALVDDAVRVQERLLARPGRERHVLARADDEEDVGRLRVERDERGREGRLVVVEVELEDRVGLQRRAESASAPSREQQEERERERGRTVTGSMTRRQDPQVPAGARGSPNSLGSSSSASSSTSISAARKSAIAFCAAGAPNVRWSASTV